MLVCGADVLQSMADPTMWRQDLLEVGAALLHDTAADRKIIAANGYFSWLPLLALPQTLHLAAHTFQLAWKASVV